MLEINSRLHAIPMVASLGLALLGAAPATSYSATANVSIVSPPSLISLGAYPSSPLLADTQGNLYGALSPDFTVTPSLYGALFSLAPDGGVKTLYGFNSSQEYPAGPLVRTSDGALYGVTLYGGANGEGSIFKLAAV
jgi:uncharacterized repeat protein (TIGR03803 family)